MVSNDLRSYFFSTEAQKYPKSQFYILAAIDVLYPDNYQESRVVSLFSYTDIPTVPHPVILRNHVLVMEFVGTNGWPAPLLKDVALNESKARELYLSAIKIVRAMYQKAMLVHADLSEFNILFSDG